jgi:hypothetical protein
MTALSGRRDERDPEPEPTAVTTTSLKVLGTCDSVNQCECCGRTGLKKTVAIGNTDGNVRYLGTECAARAMGVRKATVEKGVRSAAKEAVLAAARERARRDREEWAAYDAWKLAKFGDATNNIERHRMYRAEMGL